MRIFVSAGEPSGDLHGSNLVRALQKLDSNLDCVGFGGDRMTAAGCKLLYPLCQHATTGFIYVLAEVGRMYRILKQAEEYFEKSRPDAVVLIDYPGFHWWLARAAHKRGIPVLYFVPPQIWAWATWRVKKMRRTVDHVLCSLPFEESWYHERNVPATYVGHPYFDELPAQRLDADFLGAQKPRPGKIIGLLPGSRNAELSANLPTLLGAAERIHAKHPDTRFLVACFKQAHLERVQEVLRQKPMPYVEAHVGRTPEIIDLAQIVIAVSGSVSLELLYRTKPSVIVYRAAAFFLFLSWFMRTGKYISLPNLLADRELYPEYLSASCEAKAAGRKVIEWLDQPAELAEVRKRLQTLRNQAARPGACERSAQFIFDYVQERNSDPRSNAA